MSEKKVTDEQLLEVIRCHEGQNMTERILANLVGVSSTAAHDRLKKLEKKGLITIKTGTFITVKDKQFLPQYPDDNNAEQHIERLEHLLTRTCVYLRVSNLHHARHLLHDIEQLVLEPPKGGE